MMRKVVIVMDRKSKQKDDFLGVKRRRKRRINSIIIFHVYFCSHKEKPGRQ